MSIESVLRECSVEALWNDKGAMLGILAPSAGSSFEQRGRASKQLDLINAELRRRKAEQQRETARQCAR